MAKRKNQIKTTKITRRPKLSGDDGVVDRLERMGVGLLYASTALGQNDIAQIMGMGDTRVNEILKGIKKPNKK